jgi:hypothetical protein
MMLGAIGVLALVIAVISYTIYITHTLKGWTKPHAITWLVWALLNGFVFGEQMVAGAGPGAWVTGGAAIANLLIAGLALFKGERSITYLDWLCLALTAVLLLSWQSIDDPSIAVLLAIAIFMIGFIPTLRKSARSAHEETATTFALNGIKFFLAVAALSTISVATVVYPLVLGTVNISFAIYLVWARRYQTKKRT